MLHIITALILVLLILIFSISLKRILSNSLIAKTKSRESLKNEYEELLRKEKELRVKNSALEGSVKETTALYDISKDICKTFDKDELFSIFKKHFFKYIEAEECEFTLDAAAAQFKGYSAFPLSFENNIIGYLIARGIKEQDRDKFFILGQQYALGLRRALLYQKVQELAIIDSLTQAFSRRHFMAGFAEEFSRSKKFNHNLAFLMVDIDHFKGYNDHYGHLVGDVILREVSKAIKESIRQIDFIGRYGGEELSVILPETDKAQARFAAERIRGAVESKLISAYDENLKITISIGISVFPVDAVEPQKIIDKADEALYLAKQQGRNRVCCIY